MIQLGFHGAAGTVTGSKYLIETNGRRVLIDCGMFQGSRELRQLNWTDPPVNPKLLNAIVLTHAHIDHIGYLPRLVARGYQGPVYATAPTIDIAAISLLDTANLQMEDAEYRNKKKLTRHEVALPLFTDDDAERALKLFEPVPFNEWISIDEAIRFRYHIAGHILGAAGVEVELNDEGRTRTVFFSGDVGRYGNPLTVDPSEPPACDYLVCESTYGGKIHPPEDPHTIFADLINQVIREKGVLLIPAFAIGRTQQVLFLIHDLIEHKRIPPIDVHVDSPMAVSATDIYCKYHNLHSVDLNRLGGPNCVLNGSNVQFHKTKKSSQELNDLKGPAVIISASGMLTGGRILHHLLNRLDDEKTTVALVGFQAQGTLGRKLLDGEKAVYIHKTFKPVNARIVSLSGMSAHADYQELLHWLEPIQTPPRTVFVTHGEPDQSEAMVGHLSHERQWTCYRPQLGETIELK